MTGGPQKGTAAEEAGMTSQAGQKRRAENAAAAVSGNIAPAAGKAETMLMINRLQSKAGMTTTGMSEAEMAVTTGKGKTVDSGTHPTETARTGIGNMLIGQTGKHHTDTDGLSNLKSNIIGQSQLELQHMIQMNMIQ